MVRLLPFLLCASVATVQARLRSPRQFSPDRHLRVGTTQPQPSSPHIHKRATISFSNPKAAEYLVDGTKIPDVDFDVSPSWSGLKPISGNANETRKLFFWFWPTTNQEHTDDLVFWTNGGPGCSSLEGLIQENGPFVWPMGTAKPIRNQWAWTNLSHVLWVEQPVGTGFSQGVPNITNEDQLATQFAGFLAQFLEVFSELKGKNFYAAGESYAGFYVPYIANYLYEHPKVVDLNLKGVWITDPSVSYDLVMQYIPALNFAEGVLGLNSTFLANLQKGKLPLPSQAYIGTPNYSGIKDEYAIWDMIYEAAITVNPNFNIYRGCLARSLGHTGVPRNIGSFNNQQSPIYFNRTEVQDAIHAPRMNWDECSPTNVFVNGSDNFVPVMLSVMLSVMPNVIEKSERTIVMHGGIDYALIAEGIRIAIQNMTWRGKQGFQKPIQSESFIIEGFGVLGSMHQERNLTYVEIDLAGHMMPQYAPWAAYKTLGYLLSREELTDHTSDVALYPSSYELYGPGPHDKLLPRDSAELLALGLSNRCACDISCRTSTRSS